MTETRIVMGIVENALERDQESRVITIAAAAIAAIAAVGNSDPSTLERVLSNALRTLEGMSPEARATLHVIADEQIAAARSGKHFIALAQFKGGA